MQFDLFHSIGRIDSVHPIPSDRTIFQNFLKQCQEGESMGFSTMWVAESHFSSEVQKSHRRPVVPNYHGEIGLNADSCQLAQLILARTNKIGFGTAILNIVGGNGGPIAAADRIRSLAFLNSISDSPRKLSVGFAAGRFPFINAPFGITPRTEDEELLWGQYQRFIFLEALEIFLRLLNSETLDSAMTRDYSFEQSHFKSQQEFQAIVSRLSLSKDCKMIPYKKRWSFEPLKLVPYLTKSEMHQHVTFVLGSHDPLARDLALEFADIDIFNLSFTPPDQLNKIHDEMTTKYSSQGRTWQRSRLPRTVLVFIDRDAKQAKIRAEKCFDTYIEAMRGTVVLPPKEDLMARALIGNPDEILEQLQEGHPKGFNSQDKLMLWFEFNQVDQDQILSQMRLFSEKVIPKIQRH